MRGRLQMMPLDMQLMILLITRPFNGVEISLLMIEFGVSNDGRIFLNFAIRRTRERDDVRGVPPTRPKFCHSQGKQAPSFPIPTN